MRFQPGHIIDGRFEVLRPLGAGGMGEVYVVRHVHLGRCEALKILLPDLQPVHGIHERFRREARATSTLKHDNIIEVHDFDILADGTPYYTMELLEGEDLSATLAREGPLPWGRVRKMAFQIGRAINLAHTRGIIHRDLKPANCFRMTRDGDPDFIKVLDFGIAKVLAATTITGDGVMIGSPHYMSPEQTRGPLLDPRADIYSLGVVLFELLSGQLPFETDELPALIYAIQNTDARLLRQAAPHLDIPPGVEALVARALAKDPNARFNTIESMMRALGRLQPSPTKARPAQRTATRPASPRPAPPRLTAPRIAQPQRTPPRIDARAHTDVSGRDAGQPIKPNTIARTPELAVTDEDAATTMYRRNVTEVADAPLPQAQPQPQPRPQPKPGAAPQPQPQPKPGAAPQPQALTPKPGAAPQPQALTPKWLVLLLIVLVVIVTALALESLLRPTP